MTKLHTPALKRIEDNPDANLAIFNALVADAEDFDNEVGQVCIPFIEASDEFVEGTWVPELWLVVRKVLPEDKR
jgi:hypothetical protein